MEKILSQDEVDALMGGVVAGDVDTMPKEAPVEGAKPYDLLKQERIIRGRMPTLDMINDRFIRLQAVAWGNALRRGVDFSIGSTQVVKFGEVIKKFPLPSSLNIFHIEGLRGHGLFVMDAMLVYLLVDYFFGGKSQTHVKPEGRDFTLIQQRIIKAIVNLAFAGLSKAWEPVHVVNVQHVRSESNPQFAMVVAVSEIVIAVKFQVQIEENARELFVVYPYSMLEPIKEKLYSGFISDHLEQDLPWSNRFKEQLQDCAVNTMVRLGTAKVRVRDVLNFAPGDVLVLEQGSNEPIDCFVEGLLKFQGSAVVQRGAQAIRVTRVLS